MNLYVRFFSIAIKFLNLSVKLKVWPSSAHALVGEFHAKNSRKNIIANK